MAAQRNHVFCCVCGDSGIDDVYLCHECQLTFCSGCSVQHIATKTRPHMLLRLAAHADDSTNISQLVTKLNLNEEFDCRSHEVDGSIRECYKRDYRPAHEYLLINDKQFEWDMPDHLTQFENLTIEYIKESFRSIGFRYNLQAYTVDCQTILSEQEVIVRCLELLKKQVSLGLPGAVVHTVDLTTKEVSNVNVTMMETGTQTDNYICGQCIAGTDETTQTTSSINPEAHDNIRTLNVGLEARLENEEDLTKVSESMGLCETRQRNMKTNIGSLKLAEPPIADMTEHENNARLADNDEVESVGYATSSAKRKTQMKTEFNCIEHQHHKKLQFTEVRRKKLTSKLKHGNYTGLVRLNNGGYVLADERSCCIVLLSDSLQMERKLKFDPPAKPWNLLIIGHDEVACSLRYEDDDYDQIAFVKICEGKMKIRRKVDLPYECFCVKHLPNNNMLVSARNDIGNWLLLELTPKGKIRRKLRTAEGKKLEVIKRFVVTQSSDNTCLITYACARDNKQCIFKTFDMDGHLFSKFTYNAEDRFKAGDFCFDGQGYLYVCNKMDQTVHVLTQSGHLQSMLDCIGQPCCLHVDKEVQTLAVASSDGSKCFIQEVHVD